MGTYKLTREPESVVTEHAKDALYALRERMKGRKRRRPPPGGRSKRTARQEALKRTPRTRKGMRRKDLSPMVEQAIMLTLLEVPEFRRKAGLPPRDGYHGGGTA